MTRSRQTISIAFALTLLSSASAALRADDAGLEAEIRKRATAVEEIGRASCRERVCLVV